MLVINLPGDAPNVSLPPEPRPRPSLPNNIGSSSPESRAATPRFDDDTTSIKPDPASRRLSRRVQSLAVARLSRESSPQTIKSPSSLSPTPTPTPIPLDSATDDAIDPVTGALLDTRSVDLKALRYDVPTDIAVPTFAEPSRDVERDLARLYEAVSGARRIAVICGAGISVSSPANIPDFRSAHGLFRKLKEKHPTAGLSSGKDLFDARLFSSESTSALFYSMVAELKRLADEAQPTIFHRLLKRLDEEGRLQRVYTQNIDGLEEKAGLTFGLGEAGDSTSTVRALGKRKRLGGAGGSAWSRSKSDSHVLYAQKQQRQESENARDVARRLAEKPMFPRTIPLHGTLQTLTCAICSHKVVLGNTVHRDRDAEAAAQSFREDSASLGHDESVRALELLQNGEAVPCPRCETADEVRTSAGMRSRGVGRMKVDIVLYGGQNEGAERVGQCLQRDILGLRDPNEPPVPESAAEARARERKETREAAKYEQQRQQAQATALKDEENNEPGTKADMSVDSEAVVDSELGSLMADEESKDDILARAFANDDDAESEMRLPAATQPPAANGGDSSIADDKASTTRVTIVEPPVAAKKKVQRPRLKPLPPDLLIVAGTSLKVPGTKRIVREFAKACHAQDEWLIYSSDDEGESSSSEVAANRKNKKADRPNEKNGKGAASRSGSAEEGDENGDDAEHEIHDPHTPIRTILLNYDFPNPAREWEDVFDVWIQGDLQRAALSLFPARTVEETAAAEAKLIEQIVDSHTWAKHKAYLEEQRKLAKKEKKKSAAAERALTSGAALGLGAGRKGRFGRTVSAAAKMERSSTNSSTASTATPPPSSAPGSGKMRKASEVAASNDVGKTKARRSRSESPVKKRINTGTAGSAGAKVSSAGGLKRTTSKKNPFLSLPAADTQTTMTVEIPAIAEQDEMESSTTSTASKRKSEAGKGRDGATSRWKKEVSPSVSSAPSSMSSTCPSSREASVMSTCSTLTEATSVSASSASESDQCVLVDSDRVDSAPGPTASRSRGRMPGEKAPVIDRVGSVYNSSAKNASRRARTARASDDAA
ncbi:DHS-like NAD/FAD-binding domain-containing protein [Testicularia cyperi]|uniref:DHS-like NAD/FAD-binding domain-containing protein n=1 Tax=Testicularia cyperi TaxID=1882483 RepID=A0A317XU17_9BASI|nr:DHS-like NAD/FAD-binding domain-containing protein [Testicularia cyperi]